MPDQVGDIIVTGQRRNEGEQFPQYRLAQDFAPPGQYDEIGEITESVQDQQCAIGLNKKVWNADATASSAPQALAAKAAMEGGTLQDREAGANFIGGPGNSVSIGDIGVGPPPVAGQVATVTIPPGGATLLNWMGDIHNHPSGDPRPSADEWNVFQARVAAILAAHPARAGEMNHVATYITVTVPGSNPPSYRTYAYTRNSNPNQNGREIDPSGQPCP